MDEAISSYLTAADEEKGLPAFKEAPELREEYVQLLNRVRQHISTERKGQNEP
jgi:hypothetical protein